MMTIREVKEILKVSVNLQKENSTVLIPLLLGTYGIGKSEVSKQVAQESGLEPVFVILSAYDPSLWLIPVRDPETGLIYMKPIHTLLRKDIIIVFDEIDKARNYQLSPVLSILVGKRLGDEKINCPIICIANNDAFIYSFPALRSRLSVIPFPIPSADEVISYLTEKYSQKINQLNPFAQKIIVSVFEYCRRFGVHDGTECPLWTPRTVESLIAYIIQLDPTSLSSVTHQILMSHLGDTRYNEFMSLLEDSNFPDPHSSNPSEIVEFLKKPVSSSHFSFVRLYTLHLIECQQPHPLDEVKFLSLLPSSLIDVFVSTLQAIRNPKVSEIIAHLSSNPQTSKLISSYTTLSIK